MPNRTPAAELTAAVEHLEQLLAAATPAPWTAISSNGRKDGYAIIGALAERGTGRPVAVLSDIDVPRRHADAQLIVALVNAAPQLLAALHMSAEVAKALPELAGQGPDIETARAILGSADA